MKHTFLLFAFATLASCSSVTETTTTSPDGKVVTTKVTKSPPSKNVLQFFSDLFFELFQAER